MKKIWLAILTCLTFACLAFGVACAEDKTVLAFNEGYLAEIELGEPIMLDEYIDPSLTDDYTAILTHDETGEERDLKTLVQWTTDEPGTYTLTYTVKSGAYKGSISTKINVYVPDISWKYTNATLVYRSGDTLLFNQLKRSLNVMVTSYYSYNFRVESVQYSGGKTTFAESDTSYTFPSVDEKTTFTFTFSVESEDGQVLTGDLKVTVRPQQIITADGQAWMDENNVTVYDHMRVDADSDGIANVTLEAGYYNNSFTRDNVSYLAFNGAEGTNGYGAQTYIMTEFTGKNMPQIAFFCDEVTSSLTDGKRGIYISNGVTLNSGSLYSEHDSHRLTVFGPNKVGYGEFDNKGRLWNTGNPGDPCGMSYVALNEEHQYRYIVGFSSVSSTHATLRIILVDLTTNERVFDVDQKLTGYSTANGNQALDLSEDYFTGSIVLYGRYGHDIVLDKVYAPITDLSDAYDLDPAAEFKSGYKKNYELNTTVNVSDYIVIPETEYEFKVTDPDGEEVEIVDGQFTYTQSGQYRLYFNTKSFVEIGGVEKVVRPSSTTVRVVLDPTQPLAADYLETAGLFTSEQIKSTRWVSNSAQKYLKEGSQSVKVDSLNPDKDYGLVLGISREYMNYLFLSEQVEGISFEVYSDKALTYKLFSPNLSYPIVKDYTGSIEEGTWTKLTFTRADFSANAISYAGKQYVLAIGFNGVEALTKTDAVYIDNVQLLVKSSDPELSAEASAWMTANNATAYGYQSIGGDGSVILNAGYVIGDYKTNFTADSLSYLAFNGAEGTNGFGAQTYAIADFTGKNLPQVAFFCNDVTSSLFDGGNGIYFSNGFTMNDGITYSEHDSHRLTVFGPNKLNYLELDNKGRMWTLGSPTDACAMSYYALDENTQYRYIVGFSSVSSSHVTVRIILIDLTNYERVFDVEQKLTTYRAESGNQPLNLSSDYFTGSIVLYGRYGLETKLDKVYAPVTTSDVYTLDLASEFKSDYQDTYQIDTEVSVSDYIDVPAGEYEFTVIDPDGQTVEIIDGKFTYSKSGEYRIIYDSKADGVRANSIKVNVLFDPFEDQGDDYFETYGAIATADGMTAETNTATDYIKEGAQSIKYSNTAAGSIVVGVPATFTKLIFSMRSVDGFTFDVYAPQALSFKLNKSPVQDYTGTVEAGTWTTLTITREMVMRNYAVYTGTNSLEINFYTEEADLPADTCLYIDNIKLIAKADVSDTAAAWMEENNVTAYGYESINDDLQVKLYEGTYSSTWDKISDDSVPYIAYNGVYGAGTYVAVDFTGKSVPQFCLFVDNVTSSLTDGKQGLYIHTGMITKAGAILGNDTVGYVDGGRVTFLGPNKLEYRRPDNEGRLGKQFGTKAYDENGNKDETTTGSTVSPISIRGLEDGVHYRYVVGIKSAHVESSTKGRIVLELLLLNLDTNTEVVRYEWSEAYESLYDLIDGGSIVMYGRYNTKITLDKIYSVCENVTSMDEIDLVQSVLGNA